MIAAFLGGLLCTVFIRSVTPAPEAAATASNTAQELRVHTQVLSGQLRGYAEDTGTEIPAGDRGSSLRPNHFMSLEAFSLAHWK